MDGIGISVGDGDGLAAQVREKWQKRMEEMRSKWDKDKDGGDKNQKASPDVGKAAEERINEVQNQNEQNQQQNQQQQNQQQQNQQNQQQQQQEKV